MKRLETSLFLLAMALLAGGASALADTVNVTGSSVFVSSEDCLNLVRYRRSAGVEYKPGVDAKGRRVAPADLGGGRRAEDFFPDGTVTFNVVVNPLNYGGGNAAADSPPPSYYPGHKRPSPPSVATNVQGRFDNTSLPVARVDIDLGTGEAMINGKPLTADQDRLLMSACRKSGR